MVNNASSVPSAGSSHRPKFLLFNRRTMTYFYDFIGVVGLPSWYFLWYVYHNLGLGTKYVFLHVGWVQNLNLFSVVFLLVSTRATWDSGIKILV